MPVLIGDIVRMANQLWVVARCAPRLVQLRNWAGITQKVLNDNNVFSFVARPQDQWPFVAAPIRRTGGPVVRILRSETELTPIADWVPSGFNRSGGSIFFNPALKLRLGEVLVAHHKNGVSRIDVTPTFGTVRLRRKRAEEPEPLTREQRLLGEDPFEGLE